MALLVGGGLMASAPGLAKVPQGVDHYKCYTTTRPAFKQRTVIVKDQFVSGKTLVVFGRTLCNPVSKNQGRIVDRRVHLTCYLTRDSGIKFTRRNVSVTNQFGVRKLEVLRPVSLCVPSLKSTGKALPPDTPDPAKLVDHFRCYTVRPVSAPRTVKLTDQFTQTASKVLRVAQLCNPVSKSGGGVRRPTVHLVCYTISDAKPFKVVGVSVRNQFGLGSMRVLKPETLCVPSFKKRLG